MNPFPSGLDLPYRQTQTHTCSYGSSAEYFRQKSANRVQHKIPVRSVTANNRSRRFSEFLLRGNFSTESNDRLRCPVEFATTLVIKSICDFLILREQSKSFSMLSLAFVVTLFVVVSTDERRPFYNIAHMVNSIEEVDLYLQKGANALETDVQFSADGRAKSVYHGVPCDCFRRCMLRSGFVEYLQHVRKVSENGSTIAMLMLDLKVSEVPSSQELTAGSDIFTKLVDHLWYQVEPTRRINVLVSIPTVKHKDVFRGVLNELAKKENQAFRERIGFDVGLNSELNEISAMYKSLEISGHIWQGDGITNCLIGMRPENRLREAVDLRDSSQGYINKVYHWTLDLTSGIENSMNVGVDGIITNHPERVKALINTSFSVRYRLANTTDSPWEKIMKISKRGNLATSRSLVLDAVVNFIEMSQQALGYFNRVLRRK